MQRTSRRWEWTTDQACRAPNSSLSSWPTPARQRLCYEPPFSVGLVGGPLSDKGRTESLELAPRFTEGSCSEGNKVVL